MKVILLLIGVLVCVFMAEASSVRRAQNQFRATLKRQHNPSKAPVTTTKAPYPTTATKAPCLKLPCIGTCGDTCDIELENVFETCSQTFRPYKDTDAFRACLESHFDSDCHDCLCDLTYSNTGMTCPSYHPVTEDSGCGNTCDIESENAYLTCSQTVTPQDDPDAFMACWASLLDSDCHDCLCDFVHSKLGLTCPSS